MTDTVQTFCFVVVVPAVISLVVASLSRRCLPKTIASRSAFALALAVAFCVGYLLLRGPEVLVPSRHWHWLPYLSLGAAVIGPVALASGVSKPESGLLFLLLAIVAAWLLVPTWASLQPPRPISITIVAGCQFLLMVLLTPLATRVPVTMLPVSLTMAAVTTAVLVAACVSLTYGSLAGVAASAIGGCCASSWRKGTATETAGLIPVYALLVGGSAYVGCIEPQKPVFGVLLAPIAPLVLWAGVRGPLAQLHGAKAIAARIALLLVPLGVSAVWVVLATN